MSTWNTLFESTPVAGDTVSVTPSQFATLKSAIRERLIKEHVMNLASGLSSEDGWHVAGSAKLYYSASDPTTRPDGTTALTSADYGRMYYNTTTKYLKVYDGGSWTTPIPPDGVSTATALMLVKRDATAGAAFGGTLTAAIVAASGNVTVGGTLGVTGATTLAAVTASGLITGSAGLTISSGDTSLVALSASGLITATGGVQVPSGSYLNGGRRIETITSGSGNWTVPAGVVQVKVTAIGGGGGGASNDTPSTGLNIAGGGGGGAGCAAIAMQTVTPAASLAYSIGAGGAAGSSGSYYSGDTGSATTFNGLSAGGGGGGGGQIASSTHRLEEAGFGGTVSSGADITFPGASGERALDGNEASASYPIHGGAGGNSLVGAGGRGAEPDMTFLAKAGVFGGGGGGAAFTNYPGSIQSGGAGGDGIIILEY